jgi:hypothetical protein
MTDREIEDMLRKSGVPEHELEGSVGRILKAMGVFRAALAVVKAGERLGFGNRDEKTDTNR